MTVVQDALQPETFLDRTMKCASRTSAQISSRLDVLHLQNVIVDDVVAVAGRVRPGLVGMKKRQHHATRFNRRPQASNHRLHQAFMHVIGQVPAQHDIELGRRINQVVG